MKIQIINTDMRGSGLRSLGTPERIKEVFGFKPITAKVWTSIEKVFEKIGGWQTTVEVLNIAGQQFENPVDKFVLHKPYDQLDALVIDTVDGMYWSLKQYLLGGKDGSNQSIWDKLQNISIRLFDKFGGMDIMVVALCHEKTETKGEETTVAPFMQGAFKDNLGDYFDIIMYSRVYRKRDGTSDFRWQLIPDVYRACRVSDDKLYQFAKKYPNGEIPQDYSLLLKNTEIQNPKILVIGPYGSGKTYSLRTLKNVVPKQVKTK